MNVEMKQIKDATLEDLEDLAKYNPEVLKFLEGQGGTPALRRRNKPHKHPRVSTAQQMALKRCK